jgi:TonB family protein
VQVDGERVKIEIEGNLAPAIGDVVTLKRAVEGLDMLADLDGVWNVTNVEGRTVWAKQEPGARGVPDLECVAIIRTGAATAVVETPDVTERPGRADQGTPYQAPTGVILAPLLIHRVQPVYPELARKARMQCTVVVDVVVNTSGDVADASILKSCGPGGGFGIDDAALNAVRQWRYRPATNSGQPVDSKMATEVTFKLVRRSPGDAS